VRHAIRIGATRNSNERRDRAGVEPLGDADIVALENLGEPAALIAAAGLLIEMVLTVAVSMSAGVAAITSAVPSLACGARPYGVGRSLQG
jgi:hypothetical protein